MTRYTGIIGIVLILGLSYLFSNNRKAINLRTVITGLILQFLLAYFILKVPLGQKIIFKMGYFITRILDFANEGASFVFGVLMKKQLLEQVFGQGNGFIFIFQIIPAIIFISVLANILYHIGIMQRVISVLAKLVYWIMGVSGSEALSNVASTFVGQVEAQILIGPYLHKMTKSELLASMTGSMACIAGGIMAVYISMGVPASYLLAASVMAAPGALVISKMVFPETSESETRKTVKLEVKAKYTNLLDAIAHGASNGMKIGINVIAMLIAIIALIALINAVLGFAGRLMLMMNISGNYIGVDLYHLNLKTIFGLIFSVFAFAMGVPLHEIKTVGALLGTKMVFNEFVAYTDMVALMSHNVLSLKALVISSFALCGFANFSSVAIQVGGIGQIVPERKAEIARLGIKAMICGTFASYISAIFAGMLM